MHYIDTKLNPADCASKGLMPSELINHQLWHYGPNIDQLGFNETNPLNDDQQKVFDDSIKKNSLVLHTKRISTFSLLNKFSSHGKLVRVIGVIANFINNIITKLIGKVAHDRNSKHDRFVLISANFSNPEHMVFRSIQRECYEDEIKILRGQKELPKDSKIKGLNPFINAQGLLRVGGRLQNADLSFSQKHPVIMPKNHQAVTNLIKNAHEKTMHGSELLTLAFLRQRYYIPRVSEKVRQYIHSCMVCF